MKPDIHPAYNQLKAHCSCGTEFVIYTTLNKDLHIDICSKCHPFYTGQQKIIDTAGRVERFNAKFQRRKAGKETQDTANS